MQIGLAVEGLVARLPVARDLYHRDTGIPGQEETPAAGHQVIEQTFLFVDQAFRIPIEGTGQIEPKPVHGGNQIAGEDDGPAWHVDFGQQLTGCIAIADMETPAFAEKIVALFINQLQASTIAQLSDDLRYEPGTVAGMRVLGAQPLPPSGQVTSHGKQQPGGVALPYRQLHIMG